MRLQHRASWMIAALAAGTLAGCGGGGGAFTASQSPESAAARQVARDLDRDNATGAEAVQTSSIFDLFENVDDPNTTLEVNRYIWNASLDVLNFMPIETVDPFSGVIVMGFGTPPGSGTAYRATVYVRDPALDARSLNVALATRSGPASADTIRAVEDAILTRARQLRIRDSAL